jgi:hypothetical protein
MPSELSVSIVDMRQYPEASTHAHCVADFSKDLTREISKMLNAVGVTSGPDGVHNGIASDRLTVSITTNCTYPLAKPTLL